MVARGAQLQPDEIGVVTNYLAQSFGPGARPFASIEKPAPARQGRQTITAKDLPEEAAKAVLLRSCTECHGIDRVENTRKTAAGWQSSVKDMVRLGARLRPDETPVLVAYLVKHFGLQPSQAAPSTDADRPIAPARVPDPAQLLPDAEGKGLILGNCVQCHSIRYVTEIRKDGEGWRRTINDMIARGTQITKEEAEIIVRYLGEHRARR
jgi:mono/diheme cytochrome c family protein